MKRKSKHTSLEIPISNNLDKEQDYLILCAKMSPSERLEKCFEISSWAKRMNKHIDIELDARLSGFYVLK